MPGDGIFIQRHISCIPSPCLSAAVFVYPSAEESLQCTQWHPRFHSVTVTYQASRNPLRKIARMLSAYRKGIQEAKKLIGKPDVLHLHVLHYKHFFPLWLFRGFKGKWIFSEQWSGYFPADGRLKGPLYSLLIQILNRRLSACTAVSETLAQAMKNKGIRIPIEVVPNATAAVFSCKSESSAPGSIFRFIHVSALNDFEKNVSGILKAFAKALEQNPSMELVLAGESNRLPQFQALSRELHIGEKVMFTGYLKPQTLADTLRTCDAFVMFSFFETFSCATAEALACGLPCIVSDGGALPELIHDENGKVVPVGDESALTTAMLAMSRERGLYHPQSISRKIIEKTSEEKVGNLFLTLYKA